MKRSKIFLGLTALVFAAFGAMAATTKNTTTPAWYIHDTDGCTFYADVECEATNVPTCIEPTLPSSNKQLYLEGCQVRLERETGF